MFSKNDKAKKQSKFREPASGQPLFKETAQSKRLAELEAEILKSTPVPVSSNSSSSKALGKTPANVAAGQGALALDSRVNMLLFWVLVVLSIFLSGLPGISWFFTPINQFVTMVHEMCHALASLLTGGYVTGMTIVSDGQGHGGLTHSMGGLAFISTQAGYLGTAFVGCLLVYLGQFPKLARYVLLALGVIIISGTILFMFPGLFNPAAFLQVIASIVWGVVLGVGLIWLSRKLNDALANLLVLFLAVQTALNSLTLVLYLLPHSLGLAGGGFSDATVMQRYYFLPAIFWVFLWIALSVVMLLATLRYTYGSFLLKGRLLGPICKSLSSRKRK
jgi:hypothetical protein